MSILGRTGGQEASSSNAAFSAGFGWANLDISVTRGKAESAGGGGRRQGMTKTICDATVGAAMLDKIVVSIGVTTFVALMRWTAQRIYVWKYPTDPNPPDLAFPGWEGPVFVMQFVGIADTATTVMASGCLA